jgi:hypothetical protein
MHLPVTGKAILKQSSYESTFDSIQFNNSFVVVDAICLIPMHFSKVVM